VRGKFVSKSQQQTELPASTGTSKFISTTHYQNYQAKETGKSEARRTEYKDTKFKHFDNPERKRSLEV
jgi:hypothetical protein